MIRFLRPQDVSPSRARTVLDFLNQAGSAIEIAEATDIPGVHDIGPGIAERIVQLRDKLGGFTDIAQLLDVPLIGPVRFTWLVVSLSGPLQRRSRAGEGLPAGVAREVALLRAQVDALLASGGAGRSISLRARQERPFLGETVDLVAELQAADGEPLIGVPITLVVTWGELAARDGARELDGTSVTTRTDANGRARAVFRPSASERFGPIQRASLTNALKLLDRDAGSPREAAESLRALGREYYAPAAGSLRQAMDVFFRDFGGGLTDAIVPRDHLGVWEHIDCTVIALARDRQGGVATSAVSATAALTLRVRNWLAPWLQLMSEVIEGQSRLGVDLDLAARHADGDVIMGTVFQRLREFIGTQPGIAAEFVARRVADDALENFTSNGIAELPVATQRTLAPALLNTARTVRSTGATVLTAASQARAEVTRDLGGVIDRRVEELVPADLGKYGADIAGLRAEFSGLRSIMNEHSQSFSAFQTEIGQELTAMVRKDAFESYRAEVATELDLRVRQDAFDDFRIGIGDQFDLFVDVGTFDAFRSSIHNTLDTKVDTGTFQRFDARVTSQLTTKADVTTVNQLNQQVDDVRATTLATNATISNLGDSVRTLDVRVRDIGRPR